MGEHRIVSMLVTIMVLITMISMVSAQSFTWTWPRLNTQLEAGKTKTISW
jgi:hypothetical protein